MAETSVNTKRYLVVLLLLCAFSFIVASQLVPMRWGSNRQTTAIELGLFMIGSTAFLFVDYLFGKEKVRGRAIDSANVLYLGWVLIMGNWFMVSFFNILTISWINLTVYTAYLFYLLKLIFRKSSG